LLGVRLGLFSTDLGRGSFAKRFHKVLNNYQLLTLTEDLLKQGLPKDIIHQHTNETVKNLALTSVPYFKSINRNPFKHGKQPEYGSANRKQSWR
jgi:hypothetical protein